MNRRDVLRLATGTMALGALGPTLGWCATGPKTGLGLVVYVLGIQRRAWQKAQKPDDLNDPLTFLDFAHRLGAGGIQIPLGVRDEAYARQLRSKAEKFGMFIEGIAGPPQRDADVERFEAEMRTAHAAGACAVRTVIIPGRRYERFSSLGEFREFEKRGKRALERATPIVERHRVRLAVENHKDQRVDERVALLKHIDSEFVGACVDTGNSFSLLEDPLVVVEALAPWALTVHLKDQSIAEYEDGFLLADVALGKGFLKLKQMVDVLRRARPEVRFCLETITRDPLRVPCLTEKYWATFPTVPGSDLARTMRTVRENKVGDLPLIGELPPDQQVAAELDNIEQSLRYARDVLGL